MQTNSHYDIPEDLYNPHFNDRYFDVISAASEAREIYCVNTNLAGRLEQAELAGQVVRVGELGFGMGRTLAVVLDHISKHVNVPCAVEYSSVELFPVLAKQLRTVLNMFTAQLGAAVDLVSDLYESIDCAVGGPHHRELVVNTCRVSVTLWVGEALEMVEHLENDCDVWILDGHGPKKNPAMWRPELLTAVGMHTVNGGCCATFSVAGHVRRDLTAAGFCIEQLPGYGGKKNVLRGVKQPGTD